MMHLNLSAQSRRSRALTVASDYARAARLSRLAVLDAYDAIETAADIGVAVLDHHHTMHLGRS